MAVASVLLWKALETTPTRGSRWWSVRWTLPLVLELAALMLMVAAAAQWRPDAVPQATAIVLDHSSSMRLPLPGGLTGIESARNEAVGVLRSLHDADPAAVFIAGDWPRPLSIGTSPAEAADALAAWRPMPAPAAAPPPDLALRSALRWLERTDAASRVLVYAGDGALARWPRPEKGIQAFSLTVGGPASNSAVLDLEVKRGPGPSDSVAASFRIGRNARDGNTRQIPWRIEWEGREVNRGQVEVAAGEVSAVRVAFTDFGRGGLLTARIECNDACPEDNSMEVSIPHASFLRVALRCRPENTSLRAALLSAADMLVLESSPGSPDQAVGADVWVTEGRPGELPPPPWPSLQFLLPETGEEGHASPPLKLQDWQPDHPVLRGVDLPSVRLLELAARPGAAPVPGEEAGEAGAGSLRRWSVPAGIAYPLASGDQGIWILARERGNDRALEVAFDPLATDLPGRSDFPLLINQAVHWLVGRSDVDAGLDARVEALEAVREARRPPWPRHEARTPFPWTLPAWNAPALLALALLAASALLHGTLRFRATGMPAQGKRP